MGTLKIGQLASGAGVNVQTVRYYERKGLLAPTSRRRSGYREFLPDDVRRIRFIKNAQGLGFTLQEIVDLLELRVADVNACDTVRDRAQIKISEIATKISDLQRMKRALQGLIRSCESRSTTDECPILKSISEDYE